MKTLNDLLQSALPWYRTTIKCFSELIQSTVFDAEERRNLEQRLEDGRQSLNQMEEWDQRAFVDAEMTEIERMRAHAQRIAKVEDSLYELNLLALDTAITAAKRVNPQDGQASQG